MILFNPHDCEVPFKLPGRENGSWTIELDTAGAQRDANTVEPEAELVLTPRSLTLLR